MTTCGVCTAARYESGMGESVKNRAGSGAANPVAALALGVLAGVGGFTDTGGVVTASAAGALHGYSLAWVIVIGFIGFAVYAEMAGRIAITSTGATWDTIRLRLGRRLAVVPLVSTLVVHLLTLVVDLFGASFALQMATGIDYRMWLPPIAIGLAVLLWFLGFSKVDTVAATIGLAMLAAIPIALALGVHWGEFGRQLIHPTVVEGKEKVGNYLFAIAAMLGAFMTPYQFDFYSSGAIEERWRGKELASNRMVSLLGPAIGLVLTLALLVASAAVFHGTQHSINDIPGTAVPAKTAFGTLGFAAFLIGLFAISIAASVELCLSGAFAVCQFAGWNWSGTGRARRSPMLHLTYLGMIALALLIAITGLDPLLFTNVTMVFGAAALPFSFVPLLLIANDRQFMGELHNSRATNAAALVILALLVLVAIGAVPLLVVSGGKL